MKLKEAGFEADVREAVTRSGLHLNIGDTQLKLRHLNPRNELTTQVSNDHWTFSYNFKNKDVDCEYRTQVRPGELRIRQRIPNAQWELFPTPEFKLITNSRKLGKADYRATISYDLLSARGRLENTFEIKKFKVKANLDTSMGPHGALIFNASKPWVKSVGIDYSKKIGPVVTYQAQPSKRFLFDSAVSLQGKELWASAQVGVTRDNKIKLTAEATAKASALTKPALRLGARYTV